MVIHQPLSQLLIQVKEREERTMFINDLDKQAIRLGAYIVFLEQMIEQQKKEFEAVKTELGALKKEKEEKGKEDGELDGSKSSPEVIGTGEPEVPQSKQS